MDQMVKTMQEAPPPQATKWSLRGVEQLHGLLATLSGIQASMASSHPLQTR
jgi:hypothetical protein